jgi:hypothetical protein
MLTSNSRVSFSSPFNLLLKWAEEGERSTRYFFELEKNREKIKCGIELKTQLYVHL